jgi:hypothetical protein
MECFMQSTRQHAQDLETKPNVLSSTPESNSFFGSKKLWVDALVTRGCNKALVEKYSIDRLQKANTLLNHLQANSPVAYRECIEDYLALGLQHPALFNQTLDVIDVPVRDLLLAEAGKLGNLALVQSIYDFDHKEKSEARVASVRMSLDECATQFVLSGKREVIAWFIQHMFAQARTVERKVEVLVMPAVALGNEAVLGHVMQAVMKQDDVSKFVKSNKLFHDNLLYRAALREPEIYQLVLATYHELGIDEERLHELTTVGNFINTIANPNGGAPDFQWMKEANDSEPKLKCLKDYHVYLSSAVFQSGNSDALAALKVFFNHFFTASWSSSERFKYVIRFYPNSFQARFAAYNDLSQDEKSDPALVALFLLSTTNLEEFQSVYGTVFALVSPENLQARQQNVPRSPLDFLVPRVDLSFEEESKLIKEHWLIELLYNHMLYHKKFAAAKWMTCKDAGPHRLEVTGEFLDKIIRVSALGSSEQNPDKWNGFLPPRTTLEKLFKLEPAPVLNSQKGPR